MAPPPSHKTYLSSSLKDKCVVADAIISIQILPTFKIYRKSNAAACEEGDAGTKKTTNKKNHVAGLISLSDWLADNHFKSAAITQRLDWRRNMMVRVQW